MKDGGYGFPGNSYGCASGYTRIGPNLCMKTAPGSVGTSLTRDAITAVSSPAAGAKAVIIDIFARANSGNGIATRYTTINIYSDSGGTTYIGGVASTTREEVAVAAGTTLREESQRMVLNTANPYIQMVDDAGDQGYATYNVVGYYD